MLKTAQILKEKWLKITGFAHSQTTNKLVNKAASDSARVSRQDCKKLPALGTNQIEGFGGFCPLASLEKYIKKIITSNKLNMGFFFQIFPSKGGNYLREMINQGTAKLFEEIRYTIFP